MFPIFGESVWIAGIVIFGLRIVDVSLGTVRTISVVNGRMGLSVALGFVEVLVWVTAISQVIGGVGQNPFLAVAYAGGFAAGNGVGIFLERRIAIGHCVLRIISTIEGPGVAHAIRDAGLVVTTFGGEGRDGPRTLLYTTCRRRDVDRIIARARKVDPNLFFVAERMSSTSHLPLPHPTGWRTVFKKK
ncbi:MAG: DUF5698 domain-containing protein [Gemmatimonadota bacterium]|nr:DUF5698 domain-containing protein [Gemmatimonadota bacterium]